MSLNPKKLAGILMMSYFPFADPDGLEIFEVLEADAYRSIAADSNR